MDERLQHEWSHLFLVRVWKDQIEGEQHLWHGKVQHIATGKVGLFDDCASLLDLLASLVPSSNSPDARRREEGSVRDSQTITTLHGVVEP